MEVMTAEQAAEWGKSLSFEKVWAALMENREQMRKTDEQLRKAEEQWAKDREQMRKTDEQLRKTDEQIAETSKIAAETSRKVDELSKNVGGLNRSMGELIETLIASRLWEKFADYPYNLKRAYQRVPLYDEKNRIRTDIDILLSDTEWAMAVEVKRELNRKDEVDDHVRRMALVRAYPPLETVGKKLLGAMAGGVADPDVKDYAYKAGFFVLELSGESVNLPKPPEGFEPRQW
jgi:vacuolar-type H+-ATPase subunit I/STV1